MDSIPEISKNIIAGIKLEDNVLLTEENFVKDNQAADFAMNSEPWRIERANNSVEE